MPTMRVVSREEAQMTRKTREPGVRRARMAQFDDDVQPLVEHPEEAVVYDEIEEDPQKFVLSLRGAFARAGVSAVVRKLRGRNEVRAWVGEPVRRAVRPATQPVAATRRGRPKAAARYS
jgi:hypothetical protein